MTPYKWKVFQVPEDWHTIDYVEKTIGTASIKKRKYKGTLYLMEGVEGYEFFQLTKYITVTTLRIDGKTVMVDDPQHWIGMRKLAEVCWGKVLIGGLGLGLILHHLKNNEEVTEIDVVEVNKDVIDLIKPLLPLDNRVKIHHDNIFAYKWCHGDYNTIILDLWVKTEKKMTVAGQKFNMDMWSTFMRFKLNSPYADVYIWGYRDPRINPAVEPVSKQYLDFIAKMFK